MATPDARFWAKVDVRDGCWTWTGYRNHAGYGVWHPDKQRHVMAHRCVYEQRVGPIPQGLVLDHLCRNRLCVNPEHLEPVSIGENVLRGDTLAAHFAARTHCLKGHEFTAENLKKPRGRGRECRTCDLDRKRRAYAARMEG